MPSKTIVVSSPTRSQSNAGASYRTRATGMPILCSCEEENEPSYPDAVVRERHLDRQTGSVTFPVTSPQTLRTRELSGHRRSCEQAHQQAAEPQQAKGHRGISSHMPNRPTVQRRPAPRNGSALATQQLNPPSLFYYSKLVHEYWEELSSRTRHLT